MNLALAFCLFAAAQEDPLKGIRMGDRVELTLRSGFAVRGKLVQSGLNDDGAVVLSADPAVDLAKLGRFTLDVSLENPELPGGEMGVERVNIQSARKLKELTIEEARAMEKLRQAALEMTGRPECNTRHQEQYRQDTVPNHCPHDDLLMLFMLFMETC